MSDAAATPAPRRRRGRPRGAAGDTRERILAAAAEEFATRGYDGATMRAIAESAGVDAALLHHYFGTKSALFTATVDIPTNPAEVIPTALDGDLDGIGERLLRLLLTTWDRPEFRTRGVAMIRTIIGGRRGSALLVGFVSREILRRLGDRLGGGAEATHRTGLAASQVVGLIVTRYVLEIEPVASASVDRLVADIAPTIQRYLTEPLPPLRETAQMSRKTP